MKVHRYVYLIAVGAVVLLLAALVPGCGLGPSPEQQQVELNLIGEGLPPFEALADLCTEFTDETGIRVKIHPYEFETALQKTMLDFTGNTANYDVVMGIYFNLGKYAEAHEILPLQKFYDDPTLHDPQVRMDNFFKPVLDVSCYYHGVLYGLPATAQTMYLWYRKDLFQDPGERRAFQQRFGYPLPLPDAQHPLSWRQYRDLALFFTRHRGQKLAGRVLDHDFFGTTLQAKRHPAVWYEFSNYLYSFGGHIVDPETGEVVLDGPEARKALEFFLSLRDDSPPGVNQFTWDDALSLFQQGRIALVTMWFDSSPGIEDPAQSVVAGKVGYSTNPRCEDTGIIACQYGGWAFYINADTPHPREAYRLIEWLNRPDIQEKWASKGGLPSTISTFQSPAYQASQRRQAEYQSLLHLTAWTRSPSSEKIVTVGARYISAAVAGDLEPREALRRLASEVRAILAHDTGPAR